MLELYDEFFIRFFKEYSTPDFVKLKENYEKIKSKGASLSKYKKIAKK